MAVLIEGGPGPITQQRCFLLLEWYWTLRRMWSSCRVRLSLRSRRPLHATLGWRSQRALGRPLLAL